MLLGYCFPFRRTRQRCEEKCPFSILRVPLGESHEGWRKADCYSQDINAWSHQGEGQPQLEELQQVASLLEWPFAVALHSTEVLINPLPPLQVCHALRRLREGQTVHEIPAARSRGAPTRTGTGRGVPARRGLPALLQPHANRLDGQQRAQFHSHGGQCCSLWWDRGAVKTWIAARRLKVTRGITARLHFSSMHIHACDRWTDS